MSRALKVKRLSRIERKPFLDALARRQAKIIKGIDIIGANGRVRVRGDLSGQQIVTLSSILWEVANGGCAVCRQVTVLTGTNIAPNVAQVAVLIPCAMFDDSNIRAGIVAGNVASICRACVNLANASEATTGDVWIWTADSLDAECVPLIFPSLPKTKPILTPEQLSYIEESVRVNAERGNHG